MEFMALPEKERIVLSLFALFPEVPVPGERMADWLAEDLNAPPERCTGVLATLVESGWLLAEDGFLRLTGLQHRAVTRMVQGAPEDFPGFFASFARDFVAAGEPDRRGTRALAAELAHLWRKGRTELLGDLQHALGGSCFLHGDLRQALTWWELSYATRKKLLGKLHPKTALACFHRGLALYGQGLEEKALFHLFRAARIEKRVLPGKDPQLAMTYLLIGLCFGKMENYPLMKRYLKNSLDVLSIKFSEYVEGADLTVFAIAALADCAMDARRYAEARELYRTVEEKHRDRLDSLTLSERARFFCNLGRAFQGTGQYALAVDRYEIALALCGASPEEQELADYIRRAMEPCEQHLAQGAR